MCVCMYGCMYVCMYVYIYIYIYILFTKREVTSVRSRWPDIGRVLFLRFYGPRRSRGL